MKRKKRQAAIKEEGLRLAIEAAGSANKLAQLLGIGQPSVQQWTRVPASRILQIEDVTGVPREQLRPDLYRQKDKEHLT